MDATTSAPLARSIPLTQPSSDAGPDSSGDYDAQAQIERIRSDKTHGYHRGDQRAVDEMAALLLRASGESANPEAAAHARPSAPYTLTFPDDFTEENAPTLLREGLASTLFNLGLDHRTGQAVVDFAFGRGPEPANVPPCRITVEAATKSLKDEWRGDFDRRFKLAQVGLALFDVNGTFEPWLARKGYNRDPHSIKQLSQLGGWYQYAQPKRFNDFVKRMEADE